MSDEIQSSHTPATENPVTLRDSSGLNPNSDLNNPTLLKAIGDRAIRTGTMTEEQVVEGLRSAGIDAEIDTRTDAQKEFDATTPPRNAADYRFGELSQLMPDTSLAERQEAHRAFAGFSASLRLGPNQASDFLKDAVATTNTVKSIPEDQREAFYQNEVRKLAGLVGNAQEAIETVDGYLAQLPGEEAAKLNDAGAFSSAKMIAKLYHRIRRLQSRPS